MLFSRKFKADGRKNLEKQLVELANYLCEESYKYHQLKDNPNAFAENTARAGASEGLGHAASLLQELLNKKGIK